MLRKMFALFAGAAALALAAGPAAAADKKDEKKTLEGTLVCVKCKLDEVNPLTGKKECSHCLVVKEGDKEVKYYIKDKGGKESYHSQVCTDPKEGVKVTGVVKEKKDGDKTILYVEDAKIEFKDK